jgi:hypothetical protein
MQASVAAQEGMYLSPLGHHVRICQKDLERESEA